MADMTFHLCCTQPQWTFGFGFWVFGFQCSVLGFPFFGKLTFPTCNSLRGSGLKVVGECHLSAQNYTLLKHIKSHLVGHPATLPHLLPAHTHTHIRTPQLVFGWRKTLYQAGTHTHAERALSFCGWHDSPVLLPLSLLSFSLFLALQPPSWRSFLHADGLCLCDNRIYCFIKFVFKLPLPITLLALFRNILAKDSPHSRSVSVCSARVDLRCKWMPKNFILLAESFSGSRSG